ncbi:transposase [Streptomyces chartreusis]
MTLVERLVPDTLWTAFQEVMVLPAPRPQGGGRRRAGDREVLAAIVLVAVSQSAWRHVPPVFGVSWSTTCRRYDQWSNTGLWDRAREQLERPGQSGTDQDLSWSRYALEQVVVRAGSRRA